MRASARYFSKPGCVYRTCGGVEGCHGVVQQAQGHPVGRVLEPGDVEDEHQLPPRMVPPDRAEVPIACLLEEAACVGDNQMRRVGSCCVEHQLPEVFKLKLAVMRHRHFDAVAARQACRLAERDTVLHASCA